MDLIYITLLLMAYLSGSISTAIIICRLLTLPDPRIVGSHNPGATNVLRIGGNKAALGTLIGDMIKTAAPLALAFYCSYSAAQVSWVGVCALLGHCFPLYYHFKGGKGVASMFAVLILVTPVLSLLAFFSWLITLWTFRRSSIASITTAIIVAIFAYQFASAQFLPLSALAAVVVLRHKTNIANIISGDKPLIGAKLRKH